MDDYDWLDDDDRPVFCPLCEARDILSGCENIDGQWACPAEGCDYVWSPCSCETAGLTDRERL